MNAAQRIDRFFRSRGSPVAGHGKDFVRYGGANAFLLAAIAYAETEGGKTGTGRPGQYNLTGLGGQGAMRSYPNYTASIADSAANLRSGKYRGKSLEQVTAMWVAGEPPSSRTAPYTRSVRSILGILGGGAVSPQTVSAGRRPPRRPASIQGGPAPRVGPLPRVLPTASGYVGYGGMALPQQGIPAGQLAPAPGQAGYASRVATYHRQQPVLQRQIGRVAKLLTPPPIGPAPSTGAPARGGPQSSTQAMFTGRWPTARKGSIIGTPHSGTHNGAPPYDNWQSANAVDIGVPIGTPIVAVANGRIGRVRVKPLDGSRTSGSSVYLDTPGNELWYMHLKSVTVRPGQRVKKGQVIGYSGEGASVPHLHFSARNGDPRRYLV